MLHLAYNAHLHNIRSFIWTALHLWVCLDMKWTNWLDLSLRVLLTRIGNHRVTALRLLLQQAKPTSEANYSDHPRFLTRVSSSAESSGDHFRRVIAVPASESGWSEAVGLCSCRVFDQYLPPCFEAPTPTTFVAVTWLTWKASGMESMNTSSAILIIKQWCWDLANCQDINPAFCMSRTVVINRCSTGH